MSDESQLVSDMIRAGAVTPTSVDDLERALGHFSKPVDAGPFTSIVCELLRHNSQHYVGAATGGASELTQLRARALEQAWGSLVEARCAMGRVSVYYVIGPCTVTMRESNVCDSFAIASTPLLVRPILEVTVGLNIVLMSEVEIDHVVPRILAEAQQKARSAVTNPLFDPNNPPWIMQPWVRQNGPF